VVDASVKVACIFVDCAWGKKNQELTRRFGVTGYPTVVFCTPDGTPLGKMTSRDAEGVANDLKQLGEQYGGKAPDGIRIVLAADYEAARQDARKKSRPVLLYFADISPASISVNDALLDRGINETLRYFSCAKADFVKGSADCLKFGVTRAPTILLLDARLEKPEEKPLGRIEGSRTVRELKRELEAVLPGREPGSVPGAADLPPVARPAAGEKLSDDIIERKFIWARVAVAQDMVKRDQKGKAIDVLEDILKSYPKHKDSEDVRKILEDIRKK
jgi:hypothetical protein